MTEHLGQAPERAQVELDFEAIEAAIMETARGRWFLAEHARRNRHAETEMLLGALEALGRMIEAQKPAPAPAEPRPVSNNASARFIPSFSYSLTAFSTVRGRGAEARVPAALGDTGPVPAHASAPVVAARADATRLLQAALVGDEADTFDYRAIAKVA